MLAAVALAGIGSHNHEVIDAIASKGWDVDFYQCSFYRSLFGLETQGRGEVFEAADREAMVRGVGEWMEQYILPRSASSLRYAVRAARLLREA